MSRRSQGIRIRIIGLAVAGTRVSGVAAIGARLGAEDLRMVVLHLLFEIVEPILRARSGFIRCLGTVDGPMPVVVPCPARGMLLGPIHELLEIAVMGVGDRRVRFS